jgi:hypothetical protein
MALSTTEEFLAAWEKYGSPTLVARHLGSSVRGVQNRRTSLIAKGHDLRVWNDISDRRVVLKHDEGRIDYCIDNGVVIVFSDAHFWPGVRTTMHRSLCAMVKQLKPAMVVCNGDAFDGGTISRYPRIGWDKKPSVIEELNAVDAALEEIRTSASPGTEFIWPLGNHDARYETKLAASAPEFEGVSGFHLKDHFPHWRPCWTLWVNDDTCITHYYHSGIHAIHNNLLKGQCHYVTGHTHSLKTAMWTDARGYTKYGVDTGCLADALGPHNVDYQQGRHGNHRSGFAVLTYRNGELLMPEIAMKHDEDSFVFRGHVLHADTGAIL